MQLRLQHRADPGRVVGLLITPGLPRPVWLLQAGVLLNFFGNGLVAPYLVIYLHFTRGIPVPVAALAIGSGGILATASGLAVGPLIDRIGPRTCLSIAMCANGLAYAGYTQVHAAWQALAVGLAVGIGTGAYGPSVQSLLAAIVSREQRAAALSQQRMSAILGLSLGGVVGGLLVGAGFTYGYTALLLLDSATFVGFAVLALRLPNPRVAPDRRTGGYAAVFRDRTLRLLASVSLVMVGIGIAPMMWVMPGFARGAASVPAAAIGMVYAVNTGVILVAQLRITSAVSNRSPFAALAVGAGSWSIAWALVAMTGWLLRGWPAVAGLALALAVYAAGECVYTAVVTPTAAAIAPADLRGRYLAVMGFAWQAGFMLGPPAAGAVLATQALAFPLGAAALCALLAITLLRIGGARQSPSELPTPQR
jgi:predicted MFS family arabinose efflux permease